VAGCLTILPAAGIFGPAPRRESARTVSLTAGRRWRQARARRPTARMRRLTARMNRAPMAAASMAAASGQVPDTDSATARVSEARRHDVFCSGPGRSLRTTGSSRTNSLPTCCAGRTPAGRAGGHESTT